MLCPSPFHPWWFENVQDLAVWCRVFPNSVGKGACGSDGSTHEVGWPCVRKHQCLRLNGLLFCTQPFHQDVSRLWVSWDIYIETNRLYKGKSPFERSWHEQYWAISVATYARYHQVHRRNAEFMVHLYTPWFEDRAQLGLRNSAEKPQKCAKTREPWRFLQIVRQR